MTERKTLKKRNNGTEGGESEQKMKEEQKEL